MKTIPLPEFSAIPAEMQAAAKAACFTEMGEIADRYLKQFRADLAPITRMRPFDLTGLEPRPKNRRSDIPEWELREIAYGSF